MNAPSSPHGEAPITRREVIRRTALMLGIAATPSLLTNVLQAQAAVAGATGRPAYLEPKAFATAAAMAERILPKTDTPGAADVGVPAFLDLMFGKYLTDEEKRQFMTVIVQVEAGSRAAGQASFADLPAAQQDAVLTKIAVASQDQEKSPFGLFKELTLLGYFSSEPIGKNVLHYDPIPGRFDGCIPLAEVGNTSWTR
jgi:gluconate 2-dehydrogenase gamma chain